MLATAPCVAAGVTSPVPRKEPFGAILLAQPHGASAEDTSDSWSTAREQAVRAARTSRRNSANSAYLDAFTSEAAARLQAAIRGRGVRLQHARAKELRQELLPTSDQFWQRRRGSRKSSIYQDSASEAAAFEVRRASLLARLAEASTTNGRR